MPTAGAQRLPPQTLIHRFLNLPKCVAADAAITVVLQPELHTGGPIGIATQTKEGEEVVATTIRAELQLGPLVSIVSHRTHEVSPYHADRLEAYRMARKEIVPFSPDPGIQNGRLAKPDIQA